jgi:hypothetical protein
MHGSVVRLKKAGRMKEAWIPEIRSSSSLTTESGKKR